ncbi:hypothetical protein MKK55_12945 [Methylobacterium sp. J-059]|uniref:hypothetical protein n=1 Tax=Methylobacterium sp. J-059 TaxID=2836643 RepID=UPI001FB91F07|nr:hypothetical protein [Methylobacterium sp. J-059]MCJ2039839.1 hypothetical protein [Methylobacterium sp. J-059]
MSLIRRTQIAEALGVPETIFADPALIEVTSDERDLIEAYRRIAPVAGRTSLQRVLHFIESGREVASC